MKFIFPQNYNLKNKFLGIFDYSTIIINIVWDILVFLIVNFIFSSWSIKIFLLLLLCLPLLIFSVTGFNGERIIYVLHYMFNFVLKQKVYLFLKKDL